MNVRFAGAHSLNIFEKTVPTVETEFSGDYTSDGDPDVHIDLYAFKFKVSADLEFEDLEGGEDHIKRTFYKSFDIPLNLGVTQVDTRWDLAVEADLPVNISNDMNQQKWEMFIETSLKSHATLGFLGLGSFDLSAEGWNLKNDFSVEADRIQEPCENVDIRNNTEGQLGKFAALSSFLGIPVRIPLYKGHTLDQSLELFHDRVCQKVVPFGLDERWSI